MVRLIEPLTRVESEPDPVNLLIYFRDEIESIDHAALGRVDLLAALDRAIERFSRTDMLNALAVRSQEDR